jgi:dihydroneopterin triphosphate diphosphatase
MVERINVQAFVFTRKPELRMLILKRIPQKSGYWQPVCGGIEENEEALDAVRREVFEETGIGEILDIIDLEYSFTYEETKNGKLMKMQDVCFGAEIDTISDIKLSDEHEKYLWCSREEAKQYLKWEHNLIALDRLLEILSYTKQD